MTAERRDRLRLTGSGGANRAMEAEFKRLMVRSRFDTWLPAPTRETDSTLLYPFGPEIGWVAACYHRTSSRISWDWWSSPAVRLEPLFSDLVGPLSSDDRLPAHTRLRFSVEVGPAADFQSSPLQLRGVVKNALVDAFRARGSAVKIDSERPEVVFVVRRVGPPEDRRTLVGVDLGGGARHRRGARVAMGQAAMRETMAAQLLMLSRWDARTEPLVDPMAGSGTIPIEAAGLAMGTPVRKPQDLPFRRLPAFEAMPTEAPPLFPGTTPRVLATDVDRERIPAIVGNLRAAGLGGSPHKGSIVVADMDARDLTPEFVLEKLPEARNMKPGVFVFNPPYGVQLGAESGTKQLIALYSGLGQAFRNFAGWRAACFVANRAFVSAFGHRPLMTKPASNAELRGAFLTFRL